MKNDGVSASTPSVDPPTTVHGASGGQATKPLFTTAPVAKRTFRRTGRRDNLDRTLHPWLRHLEGLELERNGTIRVDPLSYATSVPGLFAAGDCVIRAKEVVDAVREGKSAALGIDGWLMHGKPAYF